MEIKAKLNLGAVLLDPLPATDMVGDFVVVGSRRLPANKAKVLAVGLPDEFGPPIWKVGDIVIIPPTGVTGFDYEGRQLKVVHHRRIMIGYED